MTEQAASDRPPIAAAIIVHEGRVLLVRRRVAEGELSWQFPAGEVEPGELPEDAAVREALEEVGLVVRPTGRLGVRVHPATQRIMVYIACEATTGDAQITDIDELAEVQWCDSAALARNIPYSLYPPVQEHLDARLMG